MRDEPSGENDPTQETNVHDVPMSVHDVPALDSMIAAYLAYLRGASLLSRKHAAQVEALQRLRTRLREMQHATEESQFLLTFSEAETLEEAIAGFARLCRRTIPPSKERDEVIAQCERFRGDLLRMLDQADD